MRSLQVRFPRGVSKLNAGKSWGSLDNEPQLVEEKAILTFECLLDSCLDTILKEAEVEFRFKCWKIV